MKNTAIAERQTRNQHHTEKMRKEETRTTEAGQKLTAEMLAETTYDEHNNAETKRTVTITDHRGFGTTRQGKRTSTPNQFDEHRAWSAAREKRDAEQN